jgi:nucleoid DNA-binding protein
VNPAGFRSAARFADEFPDIRSIRSLDIPSRFRELPFVAKKLTPIKDRQSKTQILDQIAANTELSRKNVAAVLDSLSDIIAAHLDKRAVGEFVLPGLLKISTIRKPAVKARKGINPFTKEEVMFKAKPATTVVKVRPLKKLKDMAL